MSAELLNLLERHYAIMERSRPGVAPRRVHVMDVTNPGTSRPENHGSPNVIVDQTRSVTSASASANSSDGQEQRLDLRPGQQGIGVTALPRLALRASDGQFQSKNLEPIDQGTQSSVGAPIARDVNVSKQNLHYAPLAFTEEKPPARDVKAGGWRPGGIPLSVMIK